MKIQIKKVIFATILAIIFSVGVRAATYTVTNTNNSGTGSLREAINSANATSADDVINFAIPSSDPNCAGGVCTITVNSELTINSAGTAGKLTITNSTGASRLLVSGNNASRVFYLAPSANLTLEGLTVTKGNGAGTSGEFGNLTSFGGNILNDQGTLTLNNSIVSNSASNTDLGGGIYNYSGTVTLNNSTVSGNKADYTGGIFNDGGTVTLNNSTVSGNTGTTGGYGGGIGNIAGMVTLTNSTISGNIDQGGYGGGIYIDFGGTVNLNSVTITNNTVTTPSGGFCISNCAGGVANTWGTVNSNNTIIAGNTNGNVSLAPDFGGAVSPASSFNLIGNGQGMSGISNGNNGNQVGTPTSPINPRLKVLGNYGGATETHEPESNSPVIDAGNTSLMQDQRGAFRPVDLNNTTYPNATGGNAADIGAFEVQIVTAAGTTVSGRAVNSSGRAVSRARITLTDQHGEIRTAATNHFGFYRFENVEAGQTVILTIESKRQQFEEPVRVIFVTGEMNEVNFTAVQQKSLRN